MSASRSGEARGRHGDRGTRPRSSVRRVEILQEQRVTTGGRRLAAARDRRLLASRVSKSLRQLGIEKSRVEEELDLALAPCTCRAELAFGRLVIARRQRDAPERQMTVGNMTRPGSALARCEVVAREIARTDRSPRARRYSASQIERRAVGRSPRRRASSNASPASSRRPPAVKIAPRSASARSSAPTMLSARASASERSTWAWAAGRSPRRRNV